MSTAPEYSIAREHWTHSPHYLVDAIVDKKANGRIYVRENGVEQEYLQVITTNRAIPRLYPMAGHPNYTGKIDWI